MFSASVWEGAAQANTVRKQTDTSGAAVETGQHGTPMLLSSEDSTANPNFPVNNRDCSSVPNSSTPSPSTFPKMLVASMSKPNSAPVLPSGSIKLTVASPRASNSTVDASGRPRNAVPVTVNRVVNDRNGAPLPRSNCFSTTKQILRTHIIRPPLVRPLAAPVTVGNGALHGTPRVPMLSVRMPSPQTITSPPVVNAASPIPDRSRQTPSTPSSSQSVAKKLRARDWDADVNRRDPPKECALCKRWLETNSGSAGTFFEYRYYEMVTTKQESKTQKSGSGASSAKRARRSSKDDSTSDSDSESECEILMAESTVRVERCSYVCNECETQFRDTTDVQTLPPCICSMLSARRTRTADACDGHRVCCTRFRYEKLCELRKKRQEWRAEQPAPQPPALKPIPPKTPPASAPTATASPLKNPKGQHDDDDSSKSTVLPDNARTQQLPNLLRTGTGNTFSQSKETVDRSKQSTVPALVNAVTCASGDSTIPPHLRRPVNIPAKPMLRFSRPISVVGPAVHKVRASTCLPSSSQAAAVGSAPFKIESIRPIMTTVLNRRSLEPNATSKPRSSETDDVVLLGEERRPVQASSTSGASHVPLPATSSAPVATSQKPRKVIRRYDTSQMRPVANFVFNIGLDLVKHYVAKSDLKALQGEFKKPPATTATQPQPQSQTSEKLTSLTNSSNDGPTDRSTEPLQATTSDPSSTTQTELPTTNSSNDGPTDSSTEPLQATTSDPSSTTQTDLPTTENLRLATALSVLAECESRVGHLCYTGLFRCKYCGFVTDSQLVFARHKLTGWLRWITESEAREIERRPNSRRERDRKPRRRAPNRKRKHRRGHDSSSSASFEPSNRGGSDDSDSSSADEARKRSSVDVNSTVQIVREEKDEKGNTVVHINGVWGIGQEPADVFVGQCCVCGFTAIRCPRAYTSHLRSKHNIALTVDEATLSIARCPLCPFTLRYRNTIFKQHIRSRCPQRFDASTNQSPSGLLEDLSFLLQGNRGSLLYEIVESEFDDTTRNKTANAPRSNATMVEALLESFNQSWDPTLVPTELSDADSGDGSPTAGSRQQHGVVTIVPVRSTNVTPKNSLRLITRPQALSDSNKSNGTHSPIDKRIELTNDGILPKLLSRQDVDSQICIFCCKQLRPGINPYHHFVGGHLMSMRLQIRQRVCPFCNLPSSDGRPILRFSSASALREHVISMHDFHSSFWWSYVLAALRESSASSNTTVTTPIDFNAIIRIHTHQDPGDVETPAASDTDSARQSNVKSATEVYCAFCSQSVGTNWNARKHFVDRHLAFVRDKIRHHLCPLCCLPQSPDNVNPRPLRFTDIVALGVHIERSHRILCRTGSAIWWPFIQAELNRIRSAITVGSPDLPKLKVIKPPVAPERTPIRLIEPQTRAVPCTHAKTGERCPFCSQTITTDAIKHFVNEHLMLVGAKISKLECPICTLLESEKASSLFSDMTALIRHVNIIHQIRYRSAFWWPFLSNALSAAAKSSLQAKTNGAALAGPSSSSVSGPGCAAPNGASPTNRFVILDAGNTRCLFCSKTITCNLLRHFSENHLSTLRTSVRNRQCPLCALPTAADSAKQQLHCYADPVKLQEHIESVHSQHQKSFWWPYLITALLAAVRTRTATDFKKVNVEVEAEADKAEAGVDAEAEADPEPESEVGTKEDDESEVDLDAGADTETGAEADTEVIDADADAESESQCKADTGANCALHSHSDGPASISSDSDSVIDCDAETNNESMEIID